MQKAAWGSSSAGGGQLNRAGTGGERRDFCAYLKKGTVMHESSYYELWNKGCWTLRCGWNFATFCYNKLTWLLPLSNLPPLRGTPPPFALCFALHCSACTPPPHHISPRKPPPAHQIPSETLKQRPGRLIATLWAEDGKRLLLCPPPHLPL